MFWIYRDISPSFLRFSKPNLSGYDLKDTDRARERERESIALFYNRVLICGSWNPPFRGAQCCTFTRIASAPFVRVRLKGADTTCEAFTLIIPTKEALARRRCRPKEHLFHGDGAPRFRNLSRADSVIGHLASFPGNYFLTMSHSCKFEKGEFSRILVSGVCLLIFMKVIYSYERWLHSNSLAKIWILKIII